MPGKEKLPVKLSLPSAYRLGRLISERRSFLSYKKLSEMRLVMRNLRRIHLYTDTGTDMQGQTLGELAHLRRSASFASNLASVQAAKVNLNPVFQELEQNSQTKNGTKTLCSAESEDAQRCTTPSASTPCFPQSAMHMCPSAQTTPSSSAPGTTAASAVGWEKTPIGGTTMFCQNSVDSKIRHSGMSTALAAPTPIVPSAQVLSFPELENRSVHNALLHQLN